MLAMAEVLCTCKIIKNCLHVFWKRRKWEKWCTILFY